ncbi:MAG: hypothetical protein JOZ98_02745 [Solirubrobacterales bacterium]|nr:hypothetical protein [Solirubrobacterales bacterium]MBV9421802.1 hypothetical protein [Solirubrobacterales bacterium]
MFAELEKIAADGYATSAGESEADVGALGMDIVVGRTGQTAISVSAPLSRLRSGLLERVLPHLRAAVAQVSASIS